MGLEFPNFHFPLSSSLYLTQRNIKSQSRDLSISGGCGLVKPPNHGSHPHKRTLNLPFSFHSISFTL
ncbi:hypothetical protein K2173_018627 [Erythroxylum novogranatense]|uniref:Uncharacterized protein n=1 Tax=Erythroxylum novogranatense TaxID=1862640 RepID=A0AAV8SAG7_9ROSI|nr:hypothetical protein K2173_018627 [Erythroxylum novogranatense]